MRFLRAITRLQVASALTLFGIALALMPLGLEAIGYELSRRQGYAILGLTALFVVAAIVVFFWPWVRGAWSWFRRDNMLREVERERDEARETLGTLEQRLEEFGVKLTGDLDKQIAKTKQLTNELRNGRLQEENRELKSELRQTKEALELSKAGERRKRIEKWRAEINAHHFQRHPLGGSWFTQTETYSEMKPYLLRNVRGRFEGELGQALHDLTSMKPRPSDKDLLLGEVARIEKEWGVI